jgi:hypothetical protein
VFNRDGWRCHLCGITTFEAKRGTFHPRAPELDHLVPISRGGAHAYANVACACRRCNRTKRALGQLMFWPDPSAIGGIIAPTTGTLGPQSGPRAENFR